MNVAKPEYPLGNDMPAPDPQNCPILHAISVIGQKWKLPLLWYLATESPIRYNALRRHLPGITNVMLTKSLRELEKDGLVCRNEIPGKSPHVEYSLTSCGMKLLPALNALYDWGKEHMEGTGMQTVPETEKGQLSDPHRM